MLSSIQTLMKLKKESLYALKMRSDGMGLNFLILNQKTTQESMPIK